MRTRAIDAGDLVLVNHLGRVFYAKVAGLERAGVLAIEPLDRRVTYRRTKAREVVDHCRTPGVIATSARRGSSCG